MKKAYIIAAAIASLAALVSCNKEEIAASQNGRTQYGPMSITINYDEVDTKTTFTQNGSTLEHVWKAGDAISVLIKENGTNEKFVLTSGAGTKSATFTCDNSYLSTITANATVNIVYPYTDKVNTTDDWWVSDISEQGNGSIDNLGNYDIQFGYNQKVTYVEGGNNTFEAASLSPMCWVLRLPAGLQLISNAPATDVITNLKISGPKTHNEELYEKNGMARSRANGDITLSNIALSNGCLVNDVYVAVMSDNNASETINISFTLQSNGSTYTYPYTHTGKYFRNGNSYKMSQAALNSTTPLIKYLPVGALAGEFSVSATRKVHFSQGNLQAKCVATSPDVEYSWGFAANQYDCVGDAAGNSTIDSQTIGKAVDLFGWSTSATLFGISASTSRIDYSGEFEDWGQIIGDGNTWRTPSTDEWKYLINTRTNASSLYKYGVTVCGKANCLIIAPDEFAETIATSYDASTWPAAEAAGLVCLPAAGVRNGRYVYIVDDTGVYWSSSPEVDGFAYDVYINNSNFVDTDSNDSIDTGCSVRLITDIK